MRVAVYGLCHNNADQIARYLKEVDQASLVFIMDIGSTDDSFALLTEAAKADPRLKISEFGNTGGDVDRSVAKSMLLHMAQSTYADWCFDFDLSQTVALYTKDWFSALVDAVKENPHATNFSVQCARLHMINNNTALDIACTFDQVSIVSGICRAVYEHPTFPILKPVGDCAVSKIIMTAIHQNPEYGMALSRQYYADNRDSQTAVYLFAAQLSWHGQLAPFVQVLINSLNFDRDYDNGQAITICHLLYQQTDDICWLYNALAICPTDSESLYRLAFAMLNDGAYWEAIGYSKHLIVHNQQGSPNLSRYRDPRILAKAYQLVATSFFQLDSVAYKNQMLEAMQTACDLWPDNSDLLSDYKVMQEIDLKEDHDTTNETESNAG